MNEEHCPNKVHNNKRRKSVLPSEAFKTSEEVLRARKLSIFALNDWKNKSNKQNQRIIISNGKKKS